MLGNGVTVNGSHPAVTALLLLSPLYVAPKLKSVATDTIGVAADKEGGTLSPRLTVTVDVKMTVPAHVPPLNSL